MIDAAQDAVFKALADQTRRTLLDRLRHTDGQTLSELCADTGMARQSATQHLDLLVKAGLVTVVRRGRERLHYLNPAPIHELQERWISTFDQPRLDALSAVRHHAEDLAMSESTTTTTVPTYVYVTYIRASADQVWHALTDADLTAAYWDHRNVSDWQAGSTWEHQRLDGSGNDIIGRVLEAEPPRRLVITFEDPEGEQLEQPSTVTFELEPGAELVRLTVTHEHLPSMGMYGGISRGWPAVLANMKSLVETGNALPVEVWSLMPAERS
ncbi:putative transcriptional regulator, ArsR family protein [Flexivirga endophytica]|uniref:Transcriptional regulator, ArsR family protein n=1 Tax=Flexivirga endophytica TaxID=1849103 RepID=A0A916T2F4_9MICO|nr:metalloregulator ArsR/SmtB family transcription factor [Flexivirga endophytica]GGB25956.1 putative transcriptional regulator, ArsR family protein [Flexivirga endophytica]GHB54511.1 putative transcriptional regulator, ArsR family protein [Flexivirga endophytica]